VRTALPQVRLRAAVDGQMPTLVGHFASFNEWTEIRSSVEGHFMERIDRGAFVRTIVENRKNIRCLWHHGLDPSVGLCVLGPIEELRGDSYHEVPLFDVDYNHKLLPGLQAGEYGMSFRFSAVKDEHRPYPPRSDANPKGIPETTVTEARLVEFGPTPFPAYKGTSAGLRSTSDVAHEVRASAYAPGAGERWEVRKKPGEIGVYERERVTAGQRASWETRPSGARGRWWLPPDTDWRLDSIPRFETATREDWHLA
jgi:phage head maturation protease